MHAVEMSHDGARSSEQGQLQLLQLERYMSMTSCLWIYR